MNKVEKIWCKIQELTLLELKAFRQWFYQFDAEVWDRQIEADFKAGKLDPLAEKAISDFASDKARKM